MAPADNMIRERRKEAHEPPYWPDTIQYLQQPIYTDAVTSELRRKLHTPTRDTAAWPKIGLDALQTPYTTVKIAAIDRPGHPAKGQHGLFAARHLAPGTFVLPYLGLIHSNADTDTDLESNYDLSFDRELELSIDATNAGNEARFMNDYRRIGDAPNVEFKDCWVQMAPGEDNKSRWERRICVFVLSAGKSGNRSAGIRRGQEIIINYGRTFWKERQVGQDSN